MAEQAVKGEPDVVIVGGGAIGVASAYYLARRGAHVVVLEAGSAVGAEASYGNAGLVSPSHCIPLATRRCCGGFPDSCGPAAPST